MVIAERIAQIMPEQVDKNKMEILLPNDVSITVNRVKQSEDDFVVSQNWDRVLEARKSYWVYGDVPLEDKYDNKSTVYLVETKFPNQDGEKISEWVTMRLVPANGRFGDPYGTEDIDLFTFTTREGESLPTSDMLKKHDIPLGQVATISRLGGINAKGEKSLKFLPLAFAAIQVMATNDAKDLGVEWIICQLHPTLQNKSLSFQGIPLNFVPAEEQLGVKEDGKFLLNREDPVMWQYIRSYPGYFLNTSSLKEVLEKSLRGQEVPVSITDLNWRNARALVPLLTAERNTKVTDTLTAGDLQDKMKREVTDAVFLALMKTPDWKHSAQSMLKIAGAGGIKENGRIGVEKNNKDRRPNYDEWNREPLNENNLDSFRALAENVVGFAALAPNSHNVQPWRFFASETKKEIEIFVDQNGILPVSDAHGGRQAFISVGCALANLELALSAYGFGYGTSLLPDKNDKYFAGKVEIGERERDTNNKIFDVIRNRRMNRGECYTDRKISDEILNEMKQCAEREGLELRLVTDRITKNAIAEFQEQADRIVLTNDKFRLELADWLLPNSTNSFVGMPGDTFGLKDVQALDINAQLKKGGLDYDLASGVAKGDSKRITTSPILGVISSPHDDPLHWIKAGKAFEQIALLNEKNNISTAVSAAIVEVDLLAKMLQMRLHTLKRPLVIFTAGYAKETRPHSPRRKVNNILQFS